MKLREFIEILEAIPLHLQEYPILVEEMPVQRVNSKLIIASHFNVFFLESTTQNIMGHAIRNQHAQEAFARRQVITHSTLRSE